MMNKKHKKLSESIDAEAKAQSIVNEMKENKAEYGSNIYIKRLDVDDAIDVVLDNDEEVIEEKKERKGVSFLKKIRNKSK